MLERFQALFPTFGVHGRLAKGLAAVITYAIVFAMIGTHTVWAATLTQAATGGSSISSDTAVNGGSNTSTALGPIVITETAAGDIGGGSTGILIFQLPAGYQWDTTSVPTAVASGTGCTGLTFGPATFANSASVPDQVKIPVMTFSTAPCVATFGGVTPFKVKVTNASPMAAAGHIYLASDSAPITGLTRGPDGTNLGDVAQVSGAVSASTSTVSASPSAVPADGASTSTVTVTLKDAGGNPVGGKNVSLVSNRSSTDTISAASGPSNASGQVTFTVKSSTMGNAVLSATDTSDNVTITQTATVTFTSAGPVSASNSTVTASPSSVPANGTTASTVTVTLKDASGNVVAGKNVSLASSRGTSDSISPASGTSNGAGVVTFSVTSGTAGTSTYTATDTTDSVTITQTATVTFGGPAGGPTLNSPANGAQLNNLGPLLDWTNPSGTNWFQVQVIPFNDDGPGINLIIGDPILVTASEYQVREPNFGSLTNANYVMLPGMTYTWRVRTATTLLAPVDADWTAWSESRTFKTVSKSSSTISRVSPSSGATVNTLRPTLEWSNSDSAVFYYEVQVSKDPNFSSGAGAAFLYWELRHGGVTNPPNSYTIPGAFPLEADTTYYWRVRPRIQGDGTPVAFSAASSFTTQ